MNLYRNDLKIEYQYDVLLLWAIYIPLCALMLQTLLYKITGVETDSRIHSAIMLISALPIVVSAFIWLKKYLRIAVFIYAIIFSVFAFHYMIYPENRAYMMEYVFNIFFISIPVLINGIVVKDELCELNVLKKASWLIFIMGVLYFVFDILAGASEGYRMSYGYYMLIPAGFFAYLYFESENIGYILMSILAVIIILVLGSRGPLAAWGFYFGILVLFSNISKRDKTLVIAATAVIVIFKDYIIKYLFYVFNNIGIAARSLTLLMTGQITHDSGRSAIILKAFDLIQGNPIIGNGIGADIRVIGAGKYPHNLFIEIFLQFGLIIGGLLLVGLIFLIVKGFMQANNKKLYLFFFSIGFIPLMISGTYLTSLPFCIFLGYVLRTTLKSHST